MLTGFYWGLSALATLLAKALERGAQWAFWRAMDRILDQKKGDSQ